MYVKKKMDVCFVLAYLSIDFVRLLRQLRLTVKEEQLFPSINIPGEEK